MHESQRWPNANSQSDGLSDYMAKVKSYDVSDKFKHGLESQSSMQEIESNVFEQIVDEIDHKIGHHGEYSCDEQNEPQPQ